MQVILILLIMKFLQESEHQILQRTYEFCYLISFSINKQKSLIVSREIIEIIDSV